MQSRQSHIEQTCFLMLVPFAASISSVGQTTKDLQPHGTPSLVAPSDFKEGYDFQSRIN